MAAHLRDVIQWIVGQVNGDSTLSSLGLKKAWTFNPPEGTKFPYISIAKQTGAHHHSLGNTESFNRHWLAVKCVDTGFDGGDRARQVMDRVKELLNHQRPTLSGGGYTISILTSNDFEFVEKETGNNNFYHCVIVFEVYLGD